MQRGAAPGPYRERLRYDGGFYLQLSLCHEWGIPHSTFLSWAPEDQAKAVAFAMAKSERCALCGTAGWEWEENRRAYYPVEHLCQGCYAKETTQEASGNSPGTTIRLVPTGSQESARLLAAQRREVDRGRRDAHR